MAGAGAAGSYRDSVNKRQLCNTVQQYETFGCYSAIIKGGCTYANYSIIVPANHVVPSILGRSVWHIQHCTT